MNISEVGAVEAVASRILDMAASRAVPGKTISADSILRDIGLGVWNAVLLMVDVEGECQISLKQFLPKHDTVDELLSLRLQDVIDATIKALKANPAVASVPAADSGVGAVPNPASTPKLTPADIKAVIVSEHYFTAGQGDARAVEDAAFSGGVLHASGRATPDDLAHVTFCVLRLRNGCKVTGVNHGSVSAANFDADEGRKRARANAIDKLWELEGYLLRERLASPKSVSLKISDEQRAELLKQISSNPVACIDLGIDPDAEKAAKLLAIVRAFVEKQRISFPEVIHQTDHVIENAYGLIHDLVGVVGYLPEEDEDDEASA